MNRLLKFLKGNIELSITSELFDVARDALKRQFNGIYLVALQVVVNYEPGDHGWLAVTVTVLGNSFDLTIYRRDRNALAEEMAERLRAHTAR